MDKSTLTKLLSITVLVVLVFNLILFLNGSFNPYKKAYQRQLEQQKQESLAREVKLNQAIDSLNLYSDKLQAKADSISVELDKEEARRKRAKDEYNKKIAELSKLSTAELPGYFAKRYDSK